MTISFLPQLDETTGKTAAQQVAEHLRSAIYDGTIKPGSRIPTQHELARHYGLSRETIRRGLHELLMEGRIESVQRVGMFVRIKPKSGEVTLCARCGDIIDKRQSS